MECELCHKEFKNKKSFSMHLRPRKDASNTQCIKFYNDLRQQLELKKDKEQGSVVCVVCGKTLRNISNTHLRRHGMTQQDYKKQFPNAPIFTDALLQIQRDRRHTTIDKRYTKEEQRQFRGEKSLNEKIKKYGSMSAMYRALWERDKDRLYPTVVAAGKAKSEKVRKLKEESPERYKEYNQQIQNKRKQTNQERYGVEFPQQLSATKRKVAQTKTQNFGSLEDAYKEGGRRSLITRYAKYGIYSHFCPVFSFNSQELFNRIKLHYSKNNNLTIRFATSEGIKRNTEFQVLVESDECCIRFLDFYIQELAVWIEFDEHHHKYQLEQDAKRVCEILKAAPQLNLMRVSEKDFLADRDEVFNRCVSFIDKAIEHIK